MRKSFLFIALIFFLLVSFIGLDLLFKQMNKEQVLTDRLLTKLKQNEYNLLNGKDRIVSWNEIQNTELCFDCLNQRIGELDEPIKLGALVPGNGGIGLGLLPPLLPLFLNGGKIVLHMLFSF